MTLKKITVAELVDGLNIHRQKSTSLHLSEKEKVLHKSLSSEIAKNLDYRCKAAGIKTNPDGTFFIPEFTGTVDEMLDYIALINYFTHKQ